MDLFLFSISYDAKRCFAHTRQMHPKRKKNSRIKWKAINVLKFTFKTKSNIKCTVYSHTEKNLIIVRLVILFEIVSISILYSDLIKGNICSCNERISLVEKLILVEHTINPVKVEPVVEEYPGIKPCYLFEDHRHKS